MSSRSCVRRGLLTVALEFERDHPFGADHVQSAERRFLFDGPGEQASGDGTTGKEKVHALVVSEIVRCFRALVKTAIAEACHLEVDLRSRFGVDQQIDACVARTTLCDASASPPIKAKCAPIELRAEMISSICAPRRDVAGMAGS